MNDQDRYDYEVMSQLETEEQLKREYLEWEFDPKAQEEYQAYLKSLEQSHE